MDVRVPFKWILQIILTNSTQNKGFFCSISPCTCQIFSEMYHTVISTSLMWLQTPVEPVIHKSLAHIGNYVWCFAF